MDKVFPTQFTFPSLRRLAESIGHTSPMALLWTYVGYSAVLTVFSGLAEAAGCLLLLFRRTAPLGAMICFVMMANVALMDFCYDVSVKMLAAHFLVFSLFLLNHDRTRLLNVLAFNRTAPPASLAEPVLVRSAGRRPAWLLVAKALVVLYVVVPVCFRSYHAWQLRRHAHDRVPLYGLYELTSLTVNGQNHPLVVTEPGLWRYVILEDPGTAVVARMDDTIASYTAAYDAATRRLELRSPKDAADLTLTPQPGTPAPALAMQGSLGGQQVTAHLRRIDPKSLTLVSRGFHWINETSFSQ